MKRVFFVFITLTFVVTSILTVQKTQSKRTSAVTTSGYAQVATNDCYLYHLPNFDESGRWFLLEQSYFVKVLNDENNQFFKVKYLDFEGFVPKSKIQFVEEYPETPYLVGITFDVYDIANVCLRETPETIDDDRNIIVTIQKGSKNLYYYGKISGEEAISGLGNIWYYCAYQNESGNVFKGYIYSPLTRNISSITSSQELLTAVNISNFVPVDSLLYLNLSTKNLLIVITAIPSLVAVLLLTLPFKKQKD